ncbi:hypothetical protein HDU93_008303 [Gonapodya sp. JEL0774]|nr:hypothetical protein HDU93_008303 [Gonapodya sp. JEL0774]
METFPTELLWRVLRLLDPRTLYKTAPRISRSFRKATLNTIPGCPRREIAIAVELLVGDWPNTELEIADDFLLSHHKQSVVWGAVRARITLPVYEVAGSESMIWDILVDRIRTSVVKTRIPHHFRLGLASAGVWLFETDEDQQLQPSVTTMGVLNAVAQFAHYHGVRELNFYGDNMFQWFTLIPQVLEFKSITMLRKGDVRLKTGQRVRTLLERFPKSRNIILGLLTSDSGAELVARRVSEERRALVTSLVVSPQYSASWSGVLRLMATPRIFPSLRELGVVCLHGKTDWVGGVGGPITTLRTLHLLLTPGQVAKNSGTILRLTPNLECVILYVMLWRFSSPDSDRQVEVSALSTLEELFQAAPRGCAFVVGCIHGGVGVAKSLQQLRESGIPEQRLFAEQVMELARKYEARLRSARNVDHSLAW